MRLLATFAGTSPEGALRFRIRDGQWLDMKFKEHLLVLKVDEVVVIDLPPCKHHGESICNCPQESRGSMVQISVLREGTARRLDS